MLSYSAEKLLTQIDSTYSFARFLQVFSRLLSNLNELNLESVANKNASTNRTLDIVF